MGNTWKPISIKIGLFVLGAVVGGAVVFGIMKWTESSSDSGSDSSSSTGSRVNSTLKYVIVVSRHGNRGQYEDYPNDPYPLSNTEYWPYGTGQLTPHGRIQEYNLGVKLRSLYNGYLNETFYTGDIFATTDLYERTMMSGELVLAGLYPPLDWQIWNKNVNWQPIPLYTNSTDHTKVINSCARYKAAKEITYDEFLENDAANITYLMNYVYNSTGQNLTADDLSDMFEKLLSEETEGYTIPAWTNEIFPNPMADFYGKSFIASCAGSDFVVGLWIGDLLGDMVDALNGVVNGSQTTRSLSYYSSHDVVILNLQVALGMPRSSIISTVKTGSAVVVELHQESNSTQFYVEVLYIDGSCQDSDPSILNLPDCKEPCYMESLVNTTLRFNNVLYIDGSSLDSDPSTLSLSDCGDPCYFETLLNNTQRFTNVSYEEECASSSSENSFLMTNTHLDHYLTQ